MTKDDLDWLLEDVGISESDALDLLAVVDWAETKRMIDIFGYPKDNEVPQPLGERLQGERFVRACAEEITDRDDPGLRRTFEIVLAVVQNSTTNG